MGYSAVMWSCRYFIAIMLAVSFANAGQFEQTITDRGGKEPCENPPDYGRIKKVCRDQAEDNLSVGHECVDMNEDAENANNEVMKQRLSDFCCLVVSLTGGEQ